MIEPSVEIDDPELRVLALEGVIEELFGRMRRSHKRFRNTLLVAATWAAGMTLTTVLLWVTR